ncbi:hypothetical protein MC378_14945 [Polaribacter sp. MSW13]|uniref:Uncharacterized protein n=1 Tax=Polaribacter marinus TaxID=2916838 RepID=A0A9X2AMR5_9FLAO|nr:hypothetical protein [Polaribacter marinus]MCI2230475.1 hypothetical protein [Polaribacter marinus]
MKKFIIIFLVIFSIFSCQNSESEKYIKIENEAINDIILEMTNFEEMKRLNKWNNEKLELYIVSELDTSSVWLDKPKGYTTEINGIKLSEKNITLNKEEYENELAEYRKEKQLFINLKNGKIKTRNLNYNFLNEKLNIHLIETEKIEKLESFSTKENEFGYLFISRIIFNRNFTKGYLHFDFFCGNGCAWDNNIEIKKINGKWKITEYFSGGIA